MKGIDMKMDMKSISKNGFLLCIFLLGAIFCALVGFYFLIMVDDEGFCAFFSLLFFAGTAGCVIGLGNVVYDECGERYGDLQYVNLKNVSAVIWYRTYLLFRGCRMRKIIVAPGEGIALPNAAAVKIESLGE